MSSEFQADTTSHRVESTGIEASPRNRHGDANYAMAKLIGGLPWKCSAGEHSANFGNQHRT